MQRWCTRAKEAQMDERTHPGEGLDTREESLAVAHSGKQISTLKYSREKEVYTMGDHWGPGESRGAEIRKDDEGERHYLLVGKGLSAEEMADTVMAWLDEHQGPDDTPPSPPVPDAPSPGLVMGLAKMAALKRRSSRAAKDALDRT